MKKTARSPFPCTQCGLCCQHVDTSDETKFLDRGDGTCLHYEEKSNFCSIYMDRPEICRIDRMYELHYQKKYSWDEFIILNQQVCKALS